MSFFFFSHKKDEVATTFLPVDAQCACVNNVVQGLTAFVAGSNTAAGICGKSWYPVLSSISHRLIIFSACFEDRWSLRKQFKFFLFSWTAGHQKTGVYERCFAQGGFEYRLSGCEHCLPFSGFPKCMSLSHVFFDISLIPFRTFHIIFSRYLAAEAHLRTQTRTLVETRTLSCILKPVTC